MKKTQQFQSATKEILIFFVYIKSIIHQNFFFFSGIHWILIFQRYFEVLERKDMWQRRPELWHNNWLLHHDNVPTHIALKTKQFLIENNTAIIPHLPILAWPSSLWLWLPQNETETEWASLLYNRWNPNRNVGSTEQFSGRGLLLCFSCVRGTRINLYVSKGTI